MSNDVGIEFVNMIEYIQRQGFGFADALDTAGRGLDVGRYFNEIRVEAEDMLPTSNGDQPSPNVRRGIILYLPPGRYRLPARDADLAPPNLADPDPRTHYELPENVQLYIGQGALLRPERNVDLIIRGSLRAGKYQIFGYERGRVAPELTGVTTAPQGRVLLWTRLVPAVYPEWWGALLFARSDQGASDSSDALQAAIDAACVHRDDLDGGVRRPSIPVLLGSAYVCFRTLVVERSESSPTLRLILRGSSGLATANLGGSSITRTATTEADRTGGCLLRLGPGVDFDIQDVRFGMNDSLPTWGCIEILGDKEETAPRRGLFRRCTLLCGSDSALRVDAPSAAAPRHVLLDACVVSSIGVHTLSRAGVDVRGDASLMLHLDDALLGAAALPAPSDAHVTPSALPANSTMFLRGASVLVRSTQFHNASGPRPTQKRGGATGEVDLSQPDGQEVFFGQSEDLAVPSAAHFTAVHCECQGWWFLSRPHGGEEQVALLNVVHSNVNWGDINNIARYQRPPLGGPPPADPNTLGRGTPPSVVWLKKGGQCVLLACRFDYTILTDIDAKDSLTDVATVFRAIAPGLYLQHFRPAQFWNSIPRSPSYEVTLIEDWQAYDFQIDHVVPIRDFGAWP